MARLPAGVAVCALALLSLAGCSQDCSWNATARAFVDDNRNGIWDGEEKPLEGASFTTSDYRGNAGYGGTSVSNAEGIASINFFVRCESNTEYFINAQAPVGYTPTTPERVNAGTDSRQTFDFGFSRNQVCGPCRYEETTLERTTL